ncbi:hypothetical protein K6W25_28885, partial [Burkholderia dolosa]|uniref:hypothetical protein n=1 Tax=Burkholderia dolosa TaxID=152500 RepID=UPI001C98450D
HSHHTPRQRGNSATRQHGNTPTGNMATRQHGVTTSRRDGGARKAGRVASVGVRPDAARIRSAAPPGKPPSIVLGG